MRLERRYDPTIVKERGFRSSKSLYESTDEDRFWQKVNRTVDGCWEYLGPRDSKQYGTFVLQEDGERVSLKAHRYSYENTEGPIPKGMQVCHKCDNPPCVRPSHLWLGTNRDNQLDAMSKGRRPLPTPPKGEGSRPDIHGEKAPWSKLTNEDVRKIRNLLPTHSQHKLAKMFGVSRGTIKGIHEKRTWRNVQ